MMVSLLLKLIFPAPPSLLINAFSVVLLILSANLGLPEKRALTIFKVKNGLPRGKKLGFQAEQACSYFYVPAFLAPLMSLVPFPHEDIRVLLLSSALAIHFFGRVFERKEEKSTWNIQSFGKLPRKSASALKIKLPSETGMLFLYVPSFLVALMSLRLFPHEDLRVLLLSSSLAIHFFKRVFEVLFIHKYSGCMVLDSVIQISSGYFVATTSMIYSQHLTQGLAEPAIDLKYYGVVLFVIGITGNFYHHYILSQLRRNGEKEYKIPKGGLFGLVICPHYLFEIIGFLGFSFISQTLHAFSIAMGSIFYLLGRSCATRRWYISKFEDFPPDVKALIPYVF